MAACTGCGRQLPGRRQKCDECKGVTGRPTKQAAPRPRPGSRVARKKPAAPPAKKATSKPPPAAPSKPTGVLAGLRPRGLALWQQLGVELDSPAGTIALEACRAVDRLDELDKVIAGKGVLNLLMFRLRTDLEDLVADPSATEVRVKIEMAGILTETRGQQSNLASLLGALGVSKNGAKPAAPTPTGPAQPSSPLDELNQRRQQREQKT